jgi:hypothetical protein
MNELNARRAKSDRPQPKREQSNKNKNNRSTKYDPQNKAGGVPVAPLRCGGDEKDTQSLAHGGLQASDTQPIKLRPMRGVHVI